MSTVLIGILVTGTLNWARFDVADHHTVQHAAVDDLVISADIPLAAEVIAKGYLALNARGDLYTEDNIRRLLNMRDCMDTLRGSRVNSGGPMALSQAERQVFANQLDRLLAK